MPLPFPRRRATLRSAASAASLAALCGLFTLLPAACADDPIQPPTETGPTCEASAVALAMERVDASALAVHLDGPADARLDFVRADLAEYLPRLWATPGLSIGAGAPAFDRAHTVWITSSEVARDLVGGAPESGYALKSVDHAGVRVHVAYAAEPGALADAAYALLDRLGVRFFHPMQDLVPDLGAPHLPRALDLRREPAFATRGLHVHLLHPLEYFDALHEPGEANLADAKKIVDWLARTGQNHLQWWLVNHPEPEAFRTHAGKIVEYGHARGITVGAVVQLWGSASLQNSYELVSSVEDWQGQIEAKLDWLAVLPWDRIEMGMGEFLAGDASSIVAWLDHATVYMADNHPATELSVQNHVGDFPDLYVEYEGETEYYYHLPQHCDARLANNVHTVFFYDLYRDQGGYGHDDFHHQREYLFSQLGTRTMRYIPESAYWVSADIDVPAFLPLFMVARSRDITGLHADTRALGLPPVEGHVLYSSGHEWGYWMTDYLAAKMIWDPEAPLSAHLADVARSFGSCSAGVERGLTRLVELQTKYLFDERLMAYVSGEDLHDDLGALADFETTPRRVAFETVLAMDATALAAFEASVVDRLGAAIDDLAEVDDTLGAACARPDEAIGSWCRELVDGAAITRLRLDHSRALYRAVIAAARGDDPAGELEAARLMRERAQTIVLRRAPDYRFPAERLVEPWANPTNYKFGYLRQAHTLCYWHRQAEQAALTIEIRGPAPVGAVPTCLN